MSTASSGRAREYRVRDNLAYLLDAIAQAREAEEDDPADAAEILDTYVTYRIREHNHA